MFLSNLSIRRPVMITMVVIALVLFGILGYLNLPLNLMPDGKIPYVTVQTVYPGASPDQVENLVTKVIEGEVSSIGLLKSTTSYSMNSASVVILEFNLDKSPDIAVQEVKDKVEAIANTLPSDAQAPVITKVDIASSPVMNIIVSGSIEHTELSYLAESVVKDRLSQIPGVGTIDVLGELDREYHVTFDSVTVYEQGISLTQAAGLLSYANIEMPAGNITGNGEAYAAALSGSISTLEDIQNVQVPTSTGMKRLSDLAVIESASEEVKERITYHDLSRDITSRGNVLLSIVKAPEGNPVELSKEVRTVLSELEAELPGGVSLNITMDESGHIQDTVNDTLKNILLGIAFTAAILLFFLHDIRSTLIVALAMPISILPTFMVMNQAGITLNLLSLMGLSTSVGVLVMNSVVVLENIFRHRRMGHGRKEAAAKGTGEVTVAVFASTMTNICVFLPLGLMGGIAGVFIGDFAWTVVIATLFSLLVSLTLTPMLASLLLPAQEKKKRGVSRLIEAMFTGIEKGYTFILRKTLHSKVRSIFIILITFAAFTYAFLSFTEVPYEFLPTMDAGDISVEVELPPSASLEKTAALVEEVEKRISAFPEVQQIVTTLGALSSMETGTNLAAIDLSLVDRSMRDSHAVVAERIAHSLSMISGADIRVAALSSQTSGFSPIDLYLKGNDIASLSVAAEALIREMEKIPGLTNATSSAKGGKAEFILVPDRNAMNELGITIQELAITLRSAVDGIVTTQLKSEGREYDIRLMLNREEITGIEDLQNIPVLTPYGAYPLSFFGEVEIREGMSSLLRVDKSPTIEITGDVIASYPLSDITSAVDTVATEILPSGIELQWAGNSSLMNETTANMIRAFIIAIILTYMLLAAMLEKIGQPILIMMTVPLSLIGVVALFLITGLAMNMASMMAIIMLVGMVVNNAILILEYTNQLRAEGMHVREALLIACPTKLQPILMANTATILGMLPMALGIGSSGVELRQPMGLVSIGGILAATLLTLFVIPAIENLVESDKHNKKLKKLAKSEEVIS